MDKKVVLKAEKINKSFPGVKVLSDVSFDLEEGEVHILLGENGAGKSTLMKIFSGLYSVDSGNIYVMERRLPFATQRIPRIWEYPLSIRNLIWCHI